VTAEIEEIFRKNGFNPGPIVVDGKIQRFRGENDSGTSCWYVINEAKTERGDTFYFGAVGDWHNRERDIKFSTLTSSRFEDRETLERSFRKVEKQVKESQAEVWEETSKITFDFWKMLPEKKESNHPYLIRKQIPYLYGCKIQLTPHGQEILVPLKDVRDKFWGFQKINEEGKKFFFPGVKKLGNFHLLGVWGPKILVCEGLATGASLHLASDLPVAVAFDTSNLAEVAIQIKRQYPDSNIFIYGDDDLFVPEDKGGNVGRKKAEEAASKVMGKAVFPKFQSLDGKPSDFNDLHCREGIEAVRDQILNSGEGIKTFIKPLGTRGGGKFFYTSSHNKNICVLDTHSEPELLKLMPIIEHWGFYFPKPKVGVDWQLARATLMEQCLAKGTFQSEKIRGSGVWLDQGRIVIHLGDRLLVDGKICDIAFFKSQFHYELDVGFSHIHRKPLSVEECARLKSVCQMFNYAHIHQMLFLGGWIALAPICGALPWRPHIWLTGEAGSGKTTIKDFIDQILDWGFKRVSVTGGTTEAGIRQRLKASALPVVFDEFEPEGKKNISRVEDTLDLMRQASSLQKGEILKGTQDQRGAAYQVSFMALVSSIKTGLLTEADRSRFSVIELESGKNNGQQWREIQRAMNEINQEYAERLVARMISMIPVIVKNARVAQEAFVHLGYSQRIGQQYGTLVAGWQALDRDSEWSLEEAIQFCQHIDLALESTVSQVENPVECLEWFLSSFVRFESNEYSIKELLNPPAVGGDSLKRIRDKFGLHIKTDGNLLIHTKNPAINKLFRSESKWGHAWAETLSRLKGVDRGRTKNLDRQDVRGLLIPRSLFHVEPHTL
jgi:putative DNA primase/helicase